MALNLSKHEEELRRAAQQVVDTSSVNWAVVGYEGQSNTLHVVAVGDGDLEEMAEHLSTGSCMYAFCRVKDTKTTLFKYVFIVWQGEGAPDTRRGICSNHIRPVSALFKGTHVTITARTEDEVEPAAILAKVSNASASKFDFDMPSQRSSSPPPAPVGSVYKKIVPSVEMSVAKEREKFWQDQERNDGQSNQTTQSSPSRPSVVPPKPARLGDVSATASGSTLKPNYVNAQRKQWEESQKESQSNGDSLPKKATNGTSKFFKDREVPVPNQSFSRPALPTGLVKTQVDPLAKKRAEDERKRFEHAQQDGMDDEKERRLKAEKMRQERMKEAQDLISGRANQEEAVMPNKPGQRISHSTGNQASKSQTSVNMSAGRDIAMDSYRDAERRKFEEQQKDSENDERERRLRSEALRQERLRELASLTHKKKSTESEGVFQTIGQTMSDRKQSASKKAEDPELVARREEEKRKWEEAQRESQIEEEERRKRAEKLKQERAQEAAALITNRGTKTASARSMFFQQDESPVQEKPRAPYMKSPTSLTASTVAAPKSPRSPDVEFPQYHGSSHPHHPNRKAEADEEERRHVADELTKHDCVDAVLPSAPAHNVNSAFQEKLRVASPTENSYEEEQRTSVVEHVTQERDLPVSPPVTTTSPPAMNAWKSGLPLRPPSDDEAEDDEWGADENSHHVAPTKTSPTAASSVAETSKTVRARALYDYQAGDDTEISFDPGEIITNIDQIDPGWWQGMTPRGEYGLFPANYVELL
ncbi:hypothetical protein RvY_07674 [Ramazzottius varieornatus]|uniref:SH3 domain-containing protein n=1 Tax=Ramazzottius varieornatus TaxID=947166 RepID=A0A1D1V384_RAMVA|nr:hypothetical protein RvY_07674 [Ramazzottius varieornatus]